MDSFVKQVAERLVDHPLPLDPRLAVEGGALDDQREVAFAGRVVAAVPAMLLAVVDKVDSRWIEVGFEAADHLRSDRASGG